MSIKNCIKKIEIIEPEGVGSFHIKYFLEINDVELFDILKNKSYDSIKISDTLLIFKDTNNFFSIQTQDDENNIIISFPENRFVGFPKRKLEIVFQSTYIEIEKESKKWRFNICK
ncbi:MAG: hypothetical protein JXL97_17725 [Bacteroidales bacterium]|nr:hypothetical protein [Bacteroidales bacterium]